MYQAIKFYIYVVISLTIVLTLQGCFLHSSVGLGYSVDIKVKDATITDVIFIETIAKREKFGEINISSSESRECVHLIKELIEPEFQHLQGYKFITIGYCYNRNNKLNDLEFSIYNDWAGQELVIKKEIDRLSEVFYAELVSKYGKERVAIERRRTGPPF